MNQTRIRRQLLIIALAATSAIGAGAFLQYLELREQSARFAAIRVDLDDTEKIDRIAHELALERELTLVMALESKRGSQDRRGVADARSAVDASFAMILDGKMAGRKARRAAELAAIRASVDDQQLDAAVVFERYGTLIALMNDSANRRLSAGMIEIGITFEHVNALREAVERLARLRAKMAGMIGRQQAPAFIVADHTRQRILFDEALRRYTLAGPEADDLALRPYETEAMVAMRQQWLAFDRSPEAFLNSTTKDKWWLLATEAVDGYRAALQTESFELKRQARDRMVQIEARIRWTLAAFVTLGALTLGLVFATFRRVMRGFERVLGGIEQITSGQSVGQRIGGLAADEFGRIGDGVNRLVGMVERLVAEREAIALQDSLTGVLNRAGLQAQIDARFDTRRREQREYGLLLVDVDYFKRINDSAGHLAGDAVLARLGGVLREAVRPDDVVGRYGGEEFLVLLAGCREEQLSAAAEKIRAAVDRENFGIGRGVTVSVGAAYVNAGDNFTARLRAADAALYRAKSEGRNRIVVADASPSPVASD